MSKNKKIVFLSILALIMVMPIVSADNGGAGVEINTIALVLDIILLGGMAVIYFGSVFAGELKKSFNYVFAGIFIFAINHLVETILFAMGIETDLNEIIHRLIHLAGFALLIYGFYRVRKTIEKLK